MCGSAVKYVILVVCYGSLQQHLYPSSHPCGCCWECSATPSAPVSTIVFTCNSFMTFLWRIRIRKFFWIRSRFCPTPNPDLGMAFRSGSRLKGPGSEILVKWPNHLCFRSGSFQSGSGLDCLSQVRIRFGLPFPSSDSDQTTFPNLRIWKI